jgi:hypothetical protein
MRSRLRPSPAMVVALIALFVAMGGTAAALSGSNTVQSDDLGPGAQVKAADVADNAVNGADVVDGSLGGADVKESSFGLVPNASHATNSSQLGGLAATGYQRRVIGTCNGGAIRAINGEGAVDCTDPAVFPIAADISSNAPNFAQIGFGPSNLSLLVVCGPSSGQARFINDGPGGATVNWLFSQGGTSSTVNASGTSLATAGQGDSFVNFNFANRLEGQWIFADAAGVTTVNLHAFIAPGSPAGCEFKGTAEFAPRS